MIYPEYSFVNETTVDLLVDEPGDLAKIKKAVGKIVLLGDDQIHIKEILSVEELHTEQYTAKIRVSIIDSDFVDSETIDDINLL